MLYQRRFLFGIWAGACFSKQSSSAQARMYVILAGRWGNESSMESSIQTTDTHNTRRRISRTTRKERSSPPSSSNVCTETLAEAAHRDVVRTHCYRCAQGTVSRFDSHMYRLSAAVLHICLPLSARSHACCHSRCRPFPFLDDMNQSGAHTSPEPTDTVSQFHSQIHRVLLSCICALPSRRELTSAVTRTAAPFSVVHLEGN